MNQPLYQKIYDDLLKKILSRSLLPNAQLPTEKELSAKYSVSRITSKRALTELEQQGYIYRVQGKGSFVKENLPKHKHKRILLSTPFTGKFIGSYIEGLEPVITASGYDLLVVSNDALKHRSCEGILQEFSGLIYYAENVEDNLDLLFELESENFPFAVLDKRFYELKAPAILSDNFSGGKAATAHLALKGHEKIAFIFGEPNHPQSVRQRYLGYLSALKEANLGFHSSLDDFAIGDGLIKLLTAEHITGLVCENDLTAIEMMRLIRRQGLSIPEDFSVVGFDDIQAAALVDPPLTTISQDFNSLGRLAGETLLDCIAGAETADESTLPVKLMERASVKHL